MLVGEVLVDEVVTVEVDGVVVIEGVLGTEEVGGVVVVVGFVVKD